MVIKSIDPNKFYMSVATMVEGENPNVNQFQIQDWCEKIYGTKRSKDARTSNPIGLFPYAKDGRRDAPRLYDAWHEFGKTLGDCDWVVIEKPDHAARIPGYGGKHSAEFDGKNYRSGSPNALTRGLVDLGLVVGALVSGVPTSTRVVEPREWKGGKKKTHTQTEVAQAYGWGYIHGIEGWLRRKYRRLGDKAIFKLMEDVVDSIGIGMWWEGRLRLYANGKFPEALEYREHAEAKRYRARKYGRRKKR